MDFSLNEEQKLLKNSAREFLEKECPSDLVREMEEDPKGYSPDLWHKMAKLGWLGWIFPTQYGGFDGDFLTLVILLEEMGRYLPPVPFLPTVILGGLSILDGGSEEQKYKFLPKIAKGELIFTMSLADFNPISLLGMDVKAIQDENQFLISGAKLFVPYANIADYFVCAARTENSNENGGGITLFLIEGENPGLSYIPLRTVALDKQYEVVFDKVKVSKGNRLGGFHQGEEILGKVFEKAVISQCGLMIGGAERVLEMTVEYAKKRVQFGRPIGSFQAIQHKCANMKIDLEGAKFITYEAAWRISQGFSSTWEVSIAKAWVNQAYNRICDHGHQIHGGIGVMKDYDIQLYSRRAKSEEFYFGNTPFHREIVAKALDL